MGRLVWTLTLGLATTFLSSAPAAQNAALTPSETARRIIKYCDEVCELQSQDQAFSLLVESFRQYRAFRIQAQYEARISAASAFGDENGSLLIHSDSRGLRALRGWVLHLAEQERELNLQNLQHQVENLRVAYQCARRADMDRIGQWVASQVDTDQAAKKLTDYVIIAAGNPTEDTFTTIDPVPASTVFLDVSPVIPGDQAPIAPCAQE